METFDPLLYPYGSRRMVHYARKGMVAASQPLAAQAGLAVLRQGGNAIDAAIATAACLTVVEPTMNGIGSDAFALVWSAGRLHGLNASGTAPGSISIEALKKQGHKEMPRHGWIPVTIPGAPAAWASLAERFGRLPLTETLQAAITYAEEGYPVSPALGQGWQGQADRLSRELKGPWFKPWFDIFAPGGRAPQIGEMWRSPDHARTLREIAETNAESFYRGNLAEAMGAASAAADGFLTASDLAAFHPDWVEPIGVNYRGYKVWEIPPNGQGLVALMALQILQGFDFTEKETVETYHRQIEAMKLAFVDGLKYITQQDRMSVTVEDLLSESYAAERRALIGDSALDPHPGKPTSGGTVYLATADGEGNMVSFIQSNYMGFGSGIVVPDTGISLLNRGANFSLDSNHDNRLEPGKRTYHTIIPGFLTRGGQAVGPFGVMGGFMQPQGHTQVVMNTVDFHLNPQSALDAPRWQWTAGRTVQVEPGVPDHIVEALIRKGHQIQRAGGPGFGKGQIIWRGDDGVLAGGAEPRADSEIASW
ncbi:MAG: gamma-glutamyltransferase family protein [Thermaerobacterales bacterium]